MVITSSIIADTLGLNTFHSRICGGSKFILGKIFNKPIIKYTVSAGPFNYKWNRIFARLYLRYFIDLILARDEITYQNVKALDVKTPILVIPDTAFLLQSYESKESKRYATLRKEKLLIGLSVSHQVQNRVSAPTNYITIMEEFVNYLIAKYHVRVVVIPNESGDTRIAAQICEKVADSCCEVLCVDSLLAQEIKGVINQCDVIIAARYHTIVAALSLGIPTLAIGWHHKYVGVLELFEQEDRLCDISDLTFEGLVSKFEDLWEDRVMIRETIIHSLPTVRKRTMKGAEEVHNHYVSFSRHPNHTSFLAATAFALIVLIYSRIINTFRLVVFRGR
jgi:polysaccharide pyruvyl transferase WcaK-like protein